MKAVILTHLSQDYFPIYIEELKTLLEIYFGRFEVDVIGKPLVKCFIYHSDPYQMYNILKRMVFRSTCIKRCLVIFDEANIDLTRFFDPPDFIFNGEFLTFACHIHDYDGDLTREESKNIIDKIYNLMALRYSFRLNLSNPDLIIGVYKKDGHYYIGLEIHDDKKGFEYRRPHKRPIFSPFSLDPKLSRLLINLSGVPDEGILIDPFCGVAGIPSEAAYIGISSLCIELKYRWAKGAYTNLKWLNSRKYWDVICGNSLDKFIKISENIFVATDPPYGRITSISSDVMKVYHEFIEKFVTEAKGSAFFSPFHLVDILRTYGLSIYNLFSIKVHKNLVRHLYVIR
ncbi:MAG TPA: hypothetical protein EYH44_04580 [Thermoprotei archaeon]|nr:hypothetical protein [Thermoprotei archaeon]